MFELYYIVVRMIIRYIKYLVRIFLFECLDVAKYFIFAADLACLDLPEIDFIRDSVKIGSSIYKTLVQVYFNFVVISNNGCWNMDTILVFDV